jgi:hypothetical protein
MSEANGSWELQDGAMRLKRAAKRTVFEDHEDQKHVFDENNSG